MAASRRSRTPASIAIIVFAIAVILNYLPVGKWLHPDTNVGKAGSAKNAEGVYNFGQATVSLSGQLEDKVFYGPPGYGENPSTDSKEHALILLLTKAIRVADGKGDSSGGAKSNVAEVQLVNLKKIPLSTYFGKKVSVTGRLFPAETGHHHTDVLLEINTIELQK